jgi:uncharacterized protein (TIGR03435 family)
MNTFGLAFTSALVDFVWQGTLVGLALLAGLHTLGRRSAQVRYGLGTIALVALLIAPILTTAGRYQAGESDHDAGFPLAQISIVPGGEASRVTDVNPRRHVTPALSLLQPWVLPLWSVGVLLLSFRLVAGGVEVRTLRRTVRDADEHMRERALRLAARMGIRGRIEIVTSDTTLGPGVIGWLRPLILLPPATAMGLTTAQLDAVLAHELAHIRRHDYLVNVIQMVAETLLFYHPVVWWVSRQLRIERESCCDDEAVRVCGDATVYARALVTMAKRRAPALAIGTTGGSLPDRVRRLLGVGGKEPRRSAPFALTATVVALTSITIASVDAQREPARFEVASVKPAAPAEARSFTGVAFLPGGVVRGTRTPLWSVITRAYDVNWKHLDGDSDLLNERYDIEAKADTRALPPDGASLEQTILSQSPMLREMLKTLLADRFKLAIHVDQRESPIYALVLGPKGHRLTPARQNCAPKTVEEMFTGGPCGPMGGGPAGGFRLRGSELSALASGLTNFLDRTVVDRTGVAGRFDIDVPPWSTGAPPRADSDEPQPDPNGPSIFTVIQQLGLRLEAARGPIDYYVIDHVERPTPN